MAPVTRPVTQLAGFTRLALEPDERRRVTFTLHADGTAFTGPDLRRVVEPGEIHIGVGASSEDVRGRLELRLTGDAREAGHGRVLTTPAAHSPV